MREPVRIDRPSHGEIGFLYRIEPGLEEHNIWRETVSPLLQGLAANIIDIWEFCVTEMINNAIDHSGGSRLTVVVRREPAKMSILVLDDGVGIFRKIKNAFGLATDADAYFELTKGKLTTDPERHSGQGIFFTSRMLDRFTILSHGTMFDHDSESPDEDWITENDAGASSTLVSMSLKNDTDRTLKNVFDEYSSGEDYDFSKTIVPLRLSKFGDEKLIARSQAKRVLVSLNKFKVVVLDFEGVQLIGQGFADEIFRVWAQAHPEIGCIVVNAAPEVLKRIESVKPAPNVEY